MPHKLIILTVFSLLFWGMAASAAQPVTIAIVTNPSEQQSQNLQDLFAQEARALLTGEFDVSFTFHSADWSATASDRVLEQVYADPGVDIVLITGFLSNQLAVIRPAFPKPTFLPLVINPELLGAPLKGDTSGRRNLNYLVDKVSFREDIQAFRRIVPFRKTVLLTDQAILDAVRDNAPILIRQEIPLADFTFIGHNGVDTSFLDTIPADTEAILLGGLPRFTTAQLQRLLEGLAENGVPTFSTALEDVDLGALASQAVDTDTRRIARRTALNIQAVLLGQPAADLSVYYEGKHELTINMQTAQTLGLSPRFDVLSEANLIRLPQPDGPAFDLQSVAGLALQQNLSVRIEEYEVHIGREDVVSARANLLPQLSVDANAVSRDRSPAVQAGSLPERSGDAALTLSQVLYSDRVSSGYRQQQLFQASREAAREAVQLDAVFDATVGYLDALRANIQLQIQQDNLNLSKSNLDLARNRVDAGSASNADVFRWESNLASARSAVLSAQAASQQSKEALNRILNRPVNAPFQLLPASTTAPFFMSEAEFNQLVNNQRSFQRLADFSVFHGLALAPELRQLQAQVDAAKRDYQSKQRALWLPDFNLQAQYSDNLGQAGIGSGGPTDREADWNVALNASLPLFSGGALRAERSRARLLVEQLQVQQQDTRQRIEQNIRASLHATQASYANIDLSRASAEAARKNLELIEDAYRLGTVSIVDLLDAQNQSLQADLSANNALHDFLLDVMNMQRATSQFEFLLPTAEQNVINQQMRDYINNTGNTLQSENN